VWEERVKLTFLWGELKGMLLRGTRETDVSLRWTEGNASEGNEGNWRIFEVNWGACFWGERGKLTFLWGELRGMLLRGTMETDVSLRWTEEHSSVRGTSETDFSLRWTVGHASEGNEGNWRFCKVNWGACFSEENECNRLSLRLFEGHASEGKEGNWRFFEVNLGGMLLWGERGKLAFFDVNLGACFWGELGKLTVLWGELRIMLLRGTRETDVSLRWTEGHASVRGTSETDFSLRWTEGHASRGTSETDFSLGELRCILLRGTMETDVSLRWTEGHASEGNEGN